MRGSRLPVMAAVMGSSIASVMAGMLLAPGPSYAQAPSVAQLQKEINRLQQQLNALQGLDQKVQVLDKQLQTTQQQQQAQQQQAQQQQEDVKKFSELPIITVGTQGLAVTSPDKQYTLKIHGIIQADGQFYTNGDDKTAPGGVTRSTFILNRVRPIVDGSVFGSYDYHIEPDFGQGKTVLQEGWLNAHPYQEVQLMIGKFKSPFGIERLQQDSNLLFIQRGLTTNLIPNRDLGLSQERTFSGAIAVGRALVEGRP